MTGAGHISVTRGRPAPAELAAVVAVLLAAAASGAGRSPARIVPRSVWAGSARTRGALPPPGQRSWRTSALPA